MATENIITGRKYRILSDAVNQIWDRISFWNKASDTEADDGSTLEYKVGAINGITDALDSEDSSIAASSVAVKNLNDSLTADNSQQFQFAYDETTQKYGYKVKEADTEVFVPFKSDDSAIFLITVITVTKYSKDMTAENTFYINSDYVEIDLTANRVNILKDIPNAVVVVKGYWSAVYKNGAIFGTDTTNSSLNFPNNHISADLKAGDYFELYGGDTMGLTHAFNIYSLEQS